MSKTTFKNITGRKIRYVRLSKHLSQQDVDRMCSLKGIEMTRSKLAKAEAGMIRITDEMLKDLAEILDVDVNVFFDDIDE